MNAYKRDHAYRISRPACFSNVWGGKKLYNYGKKAPGCKDGINDAKIGESWEISFVNGSEAYACDKKLTELFDKNSWGTNALKFEFFPVLTKFIDAREKLSVQVHPSDSYALANEGMYGKTEMWYIVDADPGAGIYIGFKEGVSEDAIRKGIKDGSIEKMLNFTEVKAGDVFFIPSGTVHAICGGVLIYEIQQNSTLTYRLYDYNRPDDSGNLRPLHIEKALAVLNYEPYSPDITATDNDRESHRVIGSCEYFTAKEYAIKGFRELEVTKESFLAFTVVKGRGVLNYVTQNGENCEEHLSAGDSFFIPAGDPPLSLTVKGELTFITVEI